MTQTQRRCIFHWCTCAPTCTYKHLTSWKCAESKQRVLFLFKRLETSTLNTLLKKKKQSAKQCSCCYMEKHAMVKVKMCSRSSWRRKKKPWRLIFPHTEESENHEELKLWCHVECEFLLHVCILPTMLLSALIVMNLKHTSLNWQWWFVFLNKLCTPIDHNSFSEKTSYIPTCSKNLVKILPGSSLTWQHAH